MGSGESPAIPRKRARVAAFSDEDGDELMDVPLDERPAAKLLDQGPAPKLLPPPIQGMEEEEGEEDEWEDVQEAAEPAEPAMRRRIEKHASCKLLMQLAVMPMIGLIQSFTLLQLVYFSATWCLPCERHCRMTWQGACCQQVLLSIQASRRLPEKQSSLE